MQIKKRLREEMETISFLMTIALIAVVFFCQMKIVNPVREILFGALQEEVEPHKQGGYTVEPPEKVKVTDWLVQYNRSFGQFKHLFKDI